jgi:hypothetical protein
MTDLRFIIYRQTGEHAFRESLFSRCVGLCQHHQQEQGLERRPGFLFPCQLAYPVGPKAILFSHRNDQTISQTSDGRRTADRSGSEDY